MPRESTLLLSIHHDWMHSIHHVWLGNCLSFVPLSPNHHPTAFVNLVNSLNPDTSYSQWFHLLIDLSAVCLNMPRCFWTRSSASKLQPATK